MLGIRKRVPGVVDHVIALLVVSGLVYAFRNFPHRLLVAGVFVVLLYILRRPIGTHTSRFIRWALPMGVRDMYGPWDTTFQKRTGGRTERATVSLQIGRRVWGTIAYPDKEKTYRFRGRLRENILLGTYELQGKPSELDLGAFTLVIDPQGNMTGKYCWTDDDNALVPGSDDYQWSRPPVKEFSRAPVETAQQDA